MALWVKFEELIELDVLLRAGIESKFEIASDRQLLEGSPYYASALNAVRESLVAGYAYSVNPIKAQQVDDGYLLSRYPIVWDAIARRVSGDPRWGRLSDAEAQELVEVVSAPFKVDEESYNRIIEICRDMAS